MNKPAARWERRIQLGAHPVAYPLIRGIERIGPAVRIPRLGVVVSDAALAREVLTDTECFSKTGPGSPGQLWTPVVGPRVLLNMEGIEHAELRRKLSGLFTPRAVAELCSRLASHPMSALRDELAAGRAVDLVSVVEDFAGAVICELVGLDAGRDGFAGAFEAGTAVTSMVRLGRPELTSRQVARAKRALRELTEPAKQAYNAGDPATVPGRMRELGLTESEAVGAVAAFILTGTETLVSYLPRLVALLHDSGWLGRLRESPELTSEAIDEGLRYTVPSPVMLRSVHRPTTVGRVSVRPGERVVIATVSAAKSLGSFDPARSHPAEVRRLWFGAGPHFCLGMPLAHAEINTVLSTVLAAGEVSIVDRSVARRVLIPSYSRLVIRA